MKRTRSIVSVITLALILSGAWLLPPVSGQGPDQAIPERIRVLEGLVAALSAQVEDLTGRVEALEAGQGSGTASFDMIHLKPLPEFPSDPTEGDVCVVMDECNGEPMKNFVCYLNGQWAGLLGCNPIIR